MGRSVLVWVACIGATVTGSIAFGRPPAKVGKEMELLKNLAGTWDVTAKAAGAESKGIAIMKLELGGRWVTSEIKVELLGQKFEQRGLGTYDTAKRSTSSPGPIRSPRRCTISRAHTTRWRRS